MNQDIINLLLGGISALGGFILHAVWQAVKELQAADVSLSEKVASIEVLVAGHYVTREDLDKRDEALFRKLDRIEMKLDAKMDKPSGR